jgi:chitin synthase
VYAFISLYLLVCSFWLAGTAFARIPELLKNKTSAEVIKSFFTPPIGALIAAAISTFGIYLVASCLYVRGSIQKLWARKLSMGITA